MAIATNTQKEALAIAYGSGTKVYISCHTLTGPGSTGANEQPNTGSPAYARKATTWTAGPVDGVNNGSQVTIDLPACTITWIGLWDAVTAGNFLDGYQLGVSQTFASQGQLLVTPSYTQS